MTAIVKNMRAFFHYTFFGNFLLKFFSGFIIINVKDFNKSRLSIEKKTCELVVPIAFMGITKYGVV